jgi:hypothetical protein
MRTLLKIALVAICAATSTALLLIAVLGGIFGMQSNAALQLSSASGLYILPTIILIEFYLLTNDVLVYVSEKFGLDFGLHFSEVPLKFDLDNSETLIPLRTKLMQLYPLSILLTLLGFVLALMTRQ